MKTLFRICILSLLVSGAITARADVPRPKPSPEKPRVVLHTSLTIVPDSKAYEARLQISQSSLAELRAALGDVSPNSTLVQRVAHSRTRTIVAGLFMFLSLSFAGVWFARTRQTRGQKAVASLVLGAAVLGGAAIIASANAGPPGLYFWRKLPQNLSKGAATNGGLDIEIVPDSSDGGGLKLIVPLRPE
jgi:hypothetical protein